MSSFKDLVDRTFLSAHGVPENRRKYIDSEITKNITFDLIDLSENFVVEHGEGTGSFENNEEFDIEVLAYGKLIKDNDYKYDTKYASFRGSKNCDFILYSDANSTIIFNEHTSSNKGVHNLDKEDKDTGHTKFQKVEIQLRDSVKKMLEVDEINDFITTCSTKICLCSYKLYNGENNTQKAFNRPLAVLAKELGEEGIKLSSPEIEQYGFEYRRISHDYFFKIS